MNQFDVISSTGNKFLLFRNGVDCSCVAEGSIEYDYSIKTPQDAEQRVKKTFDGFFRSFINTAPVDSVCDKCYSLGKLFSPLVTEAFRKQVDTNRYGGQVLSPSFIPLENKSYIIFFDEKYSNVSCGDYIATLSDDKKLIISDVFEVINVESHSYNFFSYVAITVKSIQHRMKGVDLFEYKSKARP